MTIFRSIKYFGCLFIAVLSISSLLGQDTSLRSKKLLLRDSLDFIDNKININTSANEFSPIPYKGGLLYVSKKPLRNQKSFFNKVFWVPDSLMVKITKVENSNEYGIYLKSNSDFTPPTSNDNDILFNYRLIKKNTNIIEAVFANFNTYQAFTYNDSLQLIIYALESDKKYNGKNKWELWQAKMVNGKIRNKKKLIFDKEVADYLYPFISETADTLFFASNRKESLGGYDIFYVKRNGEGWDTKPIAVENINTIADEISPSLIHDTLFFSSNRAEGLGGFDVYSNLINKSSAVLNLGYPLNSVSDELSFNKINNHYYLTTNRNGNFDILGLHYSPILYPINGVLRYKNDSSLAMNQHLYIKDNDLNIIIDSLTTDSLARYNFMGKPNRDYLVSTFNQDKQVESFAIQTFPHQTTYDYAFNLLGRSPKQIKDSIHTLFVLNESRIKDSIISNDLRQKYIVRYGFDKNVLSAKERLVLDSLLIKLSKIPSTYVIIGAFTDCVGSYKYNYELSVKRAKYVVNYLIKNGLDKDRIVSNGYSKQYTLTPCVTKYAKRNQQNSRRAEIVLSETKNTNWASLNKLKGDAYYAHINSNEFKLKTNKSLSNTLAVANKPIQLSLKQAAQLKIQDSINKAISLAALNLKNENLIKAKIERAKQDSIIAVQLAIDKQVAAQKLIAQKQAMMQKLEAQKLAAAEAKQAKQLANEIAKQKMIALANERRIKDSINKEKAIAALNLKNENLIKAKIERAKQDSIIAVQIAIDKQVEAQKLIAQKQAMLQKLEAQKQAAAEAKLLAESKANEIAKQKMIAIANERRIKDSINKANAITALNLRNENLLKAKLAQAKKDSIVKAKAKAALDLIAQVTASKKKTKDSLAALKTLTAKPNVVIAKSDLVSKPTVAEEEDMTKEEILKSLDVLAKLKLEQERIVEYLTKRINKKPILIYVSSDSVSIEIYDNGIHDNDSVSVIYNKRIVVDKQELKVNKPIKFKLKVDKESKNNELVFVAENLGTEPPNTGVMFITEKSGRRQQVVLSTDMTHNEVIYFIRIEKQ